MNLPFGWDCDTESLTYHIGSFVPHGDWTVTSGNCPKGNGFVNIEITALD